MTAEPQEPFSRASGPRSSRPGPARRIDLAFIDGVFAIVRGVRFVWTTPTAWPLAAVPIAVCTILCALSIAGSIHYVPRLMAAVWPGLESSLGGFGAGFLRFVGILLGALLGVFAATFVTPPLSAPALERLVLLRERTLGVAPRPAAGLFREFWCALQAQLVALAIGGPLLALLWLITLAAPPAAVVTVPLKFVVLALSVAWSLLDYPLSLRGVPLGERLRMMRAQSPRVLGFGLSIALLFTVPLLPLVLLPAAVAAAAEIGVQLDAPPAARV
ncbi:MAG TPA: EI24 domain-containing protein [Polyangiales bacterium]|nr:EI24 domain-containing protein [Polyangiales bacterium]